MFVQKQILSEKDLRAARIKLLKTYWPMLVGLGTALCFVSLSVVVLFRALFPMNTVLSCLIAFSGVSIIIGATHYDVFQMLYKKHKAQKVKKDIGKIIRDQYGYATDENIDSINRVVKIITKYSDMGEFRYASKEYYNLISLGLVETAALYGDGYLRVGNYHLRLPLAA